jgi:branched-chain amino acid transport system permease protein
VVGLAGLLDLGYAAFFAIGGYGAAILTASGSRLATELPGLLREPWLALGLAGFAAAGCGLLFGVPSIRTRGAYLAVVTLALGEIVPSLILHLPDLTGGPRGISGVPVASFGPWLADSPLHAYLLAALLALLVYVAATRLADSRVGRAWTAIREDELAAGAVGISAAGAKLQAFALGAGVAGAAGAIFAGLLGHIEPQQFDLTLSLMVLTAVVVGGRYGLPGVIAGALAVAAYDRLLIDLATTALRTLGAATGLAALQSADLRGDNFAVFGLADYLATLLRARRPAPAAHRRPEPAAPPAAAPTRA